MTNNITDAMIEAGVKTLEAWHNRHEDDESDDVDAVTAIYLAMQAEDKASEAATCSIGSCQRHGKCMYLNHPRCPITAMQRGPKP